MAITHFIPTIWSENLLREMDKKFIGVANCNRAFEGEIKEVGSKVKVCGIEPVTISTYTKNTNMSAPETLSDSSCELTVNRAKYFNFQIDDVDRAQSMPQLMNAAMENAAMGLANEADAYIYSLYNDAYDTIQKTVTSSNILETFIDARTALFVDGNVADANDIVFEVSPQIAAMILKAKIDLGNVGSDALEHGCIGSIAGCKIFVSNNIVSSIEDDGTAYKCYARSKRAIAYADRLSEIDAYRPELRFADAVKGLHLYGAKVFYPNEFLLLDLLIED